MRTTSSSAALIVSSTQTISIEDAYDMIKSMSWTIYNSFRGMYYVMSREDFVQEAITSFLRRKYLQKFNDAITTKPYYVFVGLKNLAIDLLRKSSARHKYYIEISENTNLRIGEEIEISSSIYELTEDLNEFSAISYLILEETVNILSRENKLKDRTTYDTDLFGIVWLSEYHIFKLALVGMLRKDIAVLFGVTEATVGNYLKRAQDKIRHWYFSNE